MPSETVFKDVIKDTVPFFILIFKEIVKDITLSFDPEYYKKNYCQRDQPSKTA